MPIIRNLAICVFHNDGRILVAKGFDDVKQEHFYRPLGGAIEFGELAADALRREIREELALDMAEPAQLGVLENRFEYRGKPGHEIAFIFDARFRDAGVYVRSEIPICEAGWDGPATWLKLDRPCSLPLYPDGLMALLDQYL